MSKPFETEEDVCPEGALAPPAEHAWCKGHVLTLNGEPELFFWSFGGTIRAWKDQANTIWCPRFLAEEGWIYGRPLPSRPGPNPFNKTLKHQTLIGIKLPDARTDISWQEIQAAAERAVSKDVPAADRADIIQDAVLEMLETHRPLSDIKSVVEACVNRHAATFDAWKPHYGALWDDDAGDTEESP